MTTYIQFASEQASSGGLGALGINLQGFLFQLITFVLVLLLLRKFVYGKLVETLEARRNAVLESLDNAKEAAAQLEKTNEKTAKLLKDAQDEAADIVAGARHEAAKVVEDASAKAASRAEHLLEQAQARIESEVASAKLELKQEMLGLVASATEKVIDTKLDAKKDAELVKKALEEARS